MKAPRLISILILAAAFGMATGVSVADGSLVNPSPVSSAVRRSHLASPLLTWNTFLGSDGYDDSRGIALDASGNMYVVGSSSATWGTPVRAFDISDDGFVAKLDSTGALVWNTFLGGIGYDLGSDIAVDANGNIYVTGMSTYTWGTPISAFTGEDYNVFAAKLDANGALTWHTFLGGDASDHSRGIALDSSGNALISGVSGGTWGTPVRPFTGDENDDAFVAKLNSDGALTWNTFLGGSATDQGKGIGTDGSGSVYVAGISGGTWGTPVRPFTGYENDDAFVAKLNSGGALTWNTFLGGSGIDYGGGIAVGGSGNTFVAGISGSTWGTPIRPFASGGNDDAFAARLNSDGALTWNTFLGGTGIDHGVAVAVHESGNVYVAGISTNTWGTPVRPFTFFRDDAFAAKLDSAGNLIGNTFLGAYEDDSPAGIEVDGDGNVYLTGTSFASWGEPIRDFAGWYEAFVAKIPNIVSCMPKPDEPLLLSPGDKAKGQGRKVQLDWSDTACAATYQVQVKAGAVDGEMAFKAKDLLASQTLTKKLKPGKYFWRVRAVNESGKRNSVWYQFKVK